MFNRNIAQALLTKNYYLRASKTIDTIKCAFV